MLHHHYTQVELERKLEALDKRAKAHLTVAPYEMATCGWVFLERRKRKRINTIGQIDTQRKTEVTDGEV